MKVYNLACSMNHRFEGWFSSEDDFVSQQKKSILSCPLCESLDITRMPSAPYLASHVREIHPVHEVKDEQKPADFPPAVNDTMHLTPDQKVVFQEKMQATMLQVVREIMTKTEDVGESFAEEARKIHYKESPQRSIRGVATSDQAADLIEEGIEVFSLPASPLLKSTLQ